jgi:hypothetical protein
MTVKGNQPRLRRQLAGLPWRQVGEAHRSAETGHGRREIRVLKVATIAAGIEFPHARQAVQIIRRTRPVSARTGRKRRWHTETVYAITDLAPHQARPDELAAWIRGHWQIENGLHWVRDMTFSEDASRIRTGAAPQVMATLRNRPSACTDWPEPPISPPRYDITAATPNDHSNYSRSTDFADSCVTNIEGSPMR